MSAKFVRRLRKKESPDPLPAGHSRERGSARTTQICRGSKCSRRRIMTAETTATRPPLPPFTRETATQKVRMAEDGWNTRDPEKVALAYAIDSRWRNRSEFIDGRKEIIAFLFANGRKSWTTGSSRNSGRLPTIASPYASLTSGTTTRVTGIAPMATRTGNSMTDGLMAARFASINDLPISESDRKYHWPLGRRPDDHPGLSDLGL